MSKERLDKILGHLGIGSRRDLKAMIKIGRVLVDGEVASDPGQQVDPHIQAITVDGRHLAFARHFYVLLHKPGGVITATSDSRQRTVLDLLPPELRHRDLFPVGRLDKETEGLLLLITDGVLGHRLLSPKRHVDKRYLAKLQEALSSADSAAFADGITLADGYRCMPAQLEISGPLEAIVTIREGKFHQIKRMFEARGNHVLYLKRLSMGPLILGDLPIGQARALQAAEVAALYEAAGLTQPL